MTKKTDAEIDNEARPMNCFAEKIRNWIWVTTILVIGVIAYVIITSRANGPTFSTTKQSIPQGGQFSTVALTRCPYCPGFLDATGRCNIVDCPIYSANWGKPPTPNNIPVKSVLIKELALEVGASDGKGSVIIHAVYPGSDAEKAGLQIGDSILRFNGRRAKSVKQFQTIVTRAKPNALLKIKILRGNKKIKTSVMIGEGNIAG